VQTAGSSSTEGVSPQSARLLVVDDDPLSSSLQAHLASLLGHSAVIENDAERGIELACGGGFDLMLLDLAMPRVDGYEVLRRLREFEAEAQRSPLPVVAVTGYASEADRLRCLMAGFNEYLSKPIHAGSLAAAIERALGARKPASSDSAPALVRDSDAERLRATVRRLAGVKPGDRQFAPTVTESFALRSAQLIENLKSAVQSADAEQAARAARALKSSAEFLGALRLSSMSARLDVAASASDWNATGELLAAIEHEHQAVLTLLFESAR